MTDLLIFLAIFVCVYGVIMLPVEIFNWRMKRWFRDMNDRLDRLSKRGNQ